jgi:tetratricopeptide (TPR) repeat protein
MRQRQEVQEVLRSLIVFLVLSCAGAAADPLAGLVEGLHWKRARALVDKQLPERGKDAHFLWLASRVRTAFGDLDRAATLCEQAAAIEPSNADYQVQLFEVYGSQAEKASLLRQPGLGRKCKRALDRALALDPRNPDALYGALLFYYQAPSLFGGDKTLARSIPAKMAAIDRVRGAHAEAKLLEMEKKPEGLEGAYRKAVDAGPERYEAHVELANHYSSRPHPDMDLAGKHARKAQQLAPDRARPYALLAAVAGHRKDFAAIEAIVAEADRNVPDNRSARLPAADAFVAADHDLSKAEGWYRDYLAQEPEPDAPPHAIAHWRLALLLEKQSRQQQAAASIEQAARLLPKHPEIRRDRQRIIRR